MSEDCLHLNIWAPASAGPHPVLVYIHGGANEAGWSGEALTAGDRFAEDGVVCVTVNYRLGALGFMELGGLLGADYAGSANVALPIWCWLCVGFGPILPVSAAIRAASPLRANRRAGKMSAL
jgi:hypothetical protein